MFFVHAVYWVFCRIVSEPLVLLRWSGLIFFFTIFPDIDNYRFFRKRTASVRPFSQISTKFKTNIFMIDRWMENAWILILFDIFDWFIAINQTYWKIKGEKNLNKFYSQSIKITSISTFKCSAKLFGRIVEADLAQLLFTVQSYKS